MQPESLSAKVLRWSCPEDWMDFETTAEVTAAAGIVGQSDAADALRFGLRIQGRGHHVYVRGAPDTGRLTLVNQLLTDLEPAHPAGLDRCYVHNFVNPDRPQLLSLRPGRACAFQARLEEFIRFLQQDLPIVLQSGRLGERTQRLQGQANEALVHLRKPFEDKLASAGFTLAMVSVSEGHPPQPRIVPVVNDTPTSLGALQAAVEQGQLDEERLAQIVAQHADFSREFAQLSHHATRIQTRAQSEIEAAVRAEVKQVVADAAADALRSYPAASAWMESVVDDVSEHWGILSKNPAAAQRYAVNVLTCRPEGAPRPVAIESVTTVQRLIGGVDPVLPSEAGPTPTAPHTRVHAGALIEAEGGWLVLEASEVLREPNAWTAVTRALRTGQVDLAPRDQAGTTLRSPGLKPQPVPLNVKVVLIGSTGLYYALDNQDPDFAQLFKVLVELDSTLPCTPASAQMYARVTARMADREGLPPFTGGAVGALMEHGVRIASSGGDVTARFGRVADIAREASFVAVERGGSVVVKRDDVENAISAGKRRADSPGRQFRQRLQRGTLQVSTRGEAVGQVNGLAVIHAGPLAYGFPMRITATVGPGTDGATHVEREVQLSGRIHSKGFLILSGVLRYLLRPLHPVRFDASITHEQSYGGIDGDSASGAEFCCLISALTRIPMRQTVAMTGAIDQFGNIEAIGAANEKIEGYFDACTVGGLTGDQGVILPASNADDLMLRRDVVDACAAGRFHIWPVARVEEALTVFTGLTAGVTDDDDRFPADSVLGRAQAEVARLWSMTKLPT